MDKTLEEELEESIKTKLELAEKIALQMAGDVENGTLSADTVVQNRLAIQNYQSAAGSLKGGEFEKAIHFFSRGCANMGEFKGRADKERKLS